ncbi:MAG: hypothetical protein MK193_10935 [Lentisphaeria bacterium]|nr:hypothetical protein [Lentisphaeria bacterium]
MFIKNITLCLMVTLFAGCSLLQSDTRDIKIKVMHLEKHITNRKPEELTKYMTKNFTYIAFGSKNKLKGKDAAKAFIGTMSKEKYHSAELITEKVTKLADNIYLASCRIMLRTGSNINPRRIKWKMSLTFKKEADGQIKLMEVKDLSKKENTSS